MVDFISAFRGPGSPGTPGAGSTATGVLGAQQARQTQQALGGLQGLAPGQVGGSDQLAQLALVNPALAAQTSQVFGDIDQKRQEAFFLDAAKVDRALSTGNINKAKTIIQNRLRDIGTLGGDPSDTQEIATLLQAGNPESIAQAKSLVRDTVIAGQISKFLPVTPGLQRIKTSEITDGNIVERRPDGSFKVTKVLDTVNVRDSGQASAVTKIYDNATVVQALPDGQIRVTDPAGNEVKGDERISVLQQARQEQIGFAQKKAGASAAGKKAIELSSNAFEQIEKIKPAIALFDEGIRLLDEGAATGTVISKLPSIRATSKQLDNLQSRMGLNVIQNTTFGSLSDAELAFALSSALPKNLAPKDLRRWLTEKRDAQVKLISYLQDVAIFLGTPGNTAAGWIEAQKALQSIDAPVKQETVKAETIEPETPKTIGRFQIQVIE